MQRSGSQKVLRVLSILSIVGSVLSFGMAALMIFGGGLYSAEGDPVGGMSAAEAGATFAGVGFATLIEGAIGLIQGILGLRASNDNTKIMPVWVLSVIGLGMGVIGFLLNLIGGGVNAETIGTSIGSILGSGIMFVLANNIKKEAGR